MKEMRTEIDNGGEGQWQKSEDGLEGLVIAEGIVKDMDFGDEEGETKDHQLEVVEMVQQESLIPVGVVSVRNENGDEKVEEEGLEELEEPVIHWSAHDALS